MFVWQNHSYIVITGGHLRYRFLRRDDLSNADTIYLLCGNAKPFSDIIREVLKCSSCVHEASSNTCEQRRDGDIQIQSSEDKNDTAIHGHKNNQHQHTVDCPTITDCTIPNNVCTQSASANQNESSLPFSYNKVTKFPWYHINRFENRTPTYARLCRATQHARQRTFLVTQ